MTPPNEIEKPYDLMTWTMTYSSSSKPLQTYATPLAITATKRLLAPGKSLSPLHSPTQSRHRTTQRNGQTMKPAKLEIPEVDYSEDNPHGCLWAARLIGYEARRGGKHGELVWQKFAFKCLICETEFRGSRMYEPPDAYSVGDMHLDPSFWNALCAALV